MLALQLFAFTAHNLSSPLSPQHTHDNCNTNHLLPAHQALAQDL